MTKKLTATALALSIALTSITAPAHAGNNDDLNRFIAGAITLFILSKAAENNKTSRRQTSRSTYNPAPKPPKPPKRPPRFNKRLPAECFFRMRSAEGSRGVYGKICLEETMRHAKRLPAVCEDTVRVRYGLRSEVYDSKCLSDRGYRVEARRR